jgi:hypothetical protein
MEPFPNLRRMEGEDLLERRPSWFPAEGVSAVRALISFRGLAYPPRQTEHQLMRGLRAKLPCVFFFCGVAFLASPRASITGAENIIDVGTVPMI